MRPLNGIVANDSNHRGNKETDLQAKYRRQGDVCRELLHDTHRIAQKSVVVLDQQTSELEFITTGQGEIISLSRNQDIVLRNIDDMCQKYQQFSLSQNNSFEQLQAESREQLLLAKRTQAMIHELQKSSYLVAQLINADISPEVSLRNNKRSYSKSFSNSHGIFSSYCNNKPRIIK